MVIIPNLELHVTHTCNLKCMGCSHYSDHGHKGILSLKEAEQWFTNWNKKVSPATLSLLGGEPTLHPHLIQFLLLAREFWPEAHLRIVTNGFFLLRHPGLSAAMKMVSNASLNISIHHNSEEYFEKVMPNLLLANDWSDNYGIKISHYKSFDNWTRSYRGFGSSMEPYFDMQPRLSWANCGSKGCYQLFEDRIWKCAPLAYLKLQDAKYKLSNKWKSYLQFEPLTHESTGKKLHDYFNLEEEDFCGMCPARPSRLELPLPFSLNRSSVKPV